MALSSRGLGIARFEPNTRETFGALLDTSYHAETNPNGVLNMSVAENYVMIPDMVQRLNETKLEYGYSDLTYGEGPWGRRRLRRALATLLIRNLQPLETIDADDLLVGNGCTPLIDNLGFSIADPGDAILFPRPIYSAFAVDFSLKARANCIFVSMKDVDQFSPACVPRFEEALIKAERAGSRVRGLMLCNPHNPTGRCYTREAVVALMKFCERHHIHLISDEVYAGSVYDPAGADTVPFTSVLSFDSTPYISKDLVHVLYGLSKDFAGGGLRMGVLHTRNRMLHRAMGQMSSFTWCGSPTEQVAIKILEDTAFVNDFLGRSHARLRQSNRFARKLLEEAGIRYAGGSNAGFFLWLDLRAFLDEQVTRRQGAWAAERALAGQLEAHRVCLTPGEVQFADEAGWFRLVFSHNDGNIALGVQRLRAALGLAGGESEGAGT